eukprot:403374632
MELMDAVFTMIMQQKKKKSQFKIEKSLTCQSLWMSSDQCVISTKNYTVNITAHNAITYIVTSVYYMTTNPMIKILYISQYSYRKILNSLYQDFIAMINQTKMLLKDFVQLNDIPKLSITYYQIKDSKDETQMDQTKEPEEDITEINICEINRQQNNTYQCIQDQASQYAGYYKHYLQLVNNEIQKVNNSTIRKYMKDWNKAELKLLYQGSRDGFTAFKFHQLCDNKGATISFVLSEFGKTFGGYTSVPWTSAGVYKEDRQAFLFQLNQRSIHPIENNFQYAVNHHPSYHLIFGGGHDLILYNQ